MDGLSEGLARLRLDSRGVIRSWLVAPGRDRDGRADAAGTERLDVRGWSRGVSRSTRFPPGHRLRPPSQGRRRCGADLELLTGTTAQIHENTPDAGACRDSIGGSWAEQWTPVTLGVSLVSVVSDDLQNQWTGIHPRRSPPN